MHHWTCPRAFDSLQKDTLFARQVRRTSFTSCLVLGSEPLSYGEETDLRPTPTIDDWSAASSESSAQLPHSSSLSQGVKGAGTYGSRREQAWVQMTGRNRTHLRHHLPHHHRRRSVLPLLAAAAATP